MTLSAVARKSGPYTGTGSATTFAYEFQIFSASDLEVYIDDTLQPTGQYSVTGVGVSTGGNVIFNTAPNSGTTIWIFGALPQEQQDVDLDPGGPISGTNLERAFDKMVSLIAEVSIELERRPAFKKTIGTALRNEPIPDPTALGLWQWNSTADGLTYAQPTILQVTPDSVTGLAFVKTATTVNASAGVGALTASSAFPAGSAAWFAVGRVTTAFGTTNGLTGIALGDPDEGGEIWTASMGITLNAISNVGQHQNRMPNLYNNAARDVLITALGGDFDATGQIKITTLSVTMTPDT